LTISPHQDPPPPALCSEPAGFPLRRWLPLIAIVAVSLTALAMGWHQGLSFSTLARYHATLQEFIAGNAAVSVAAYVALYILLVALSVPGGAFLTVCGGILFGAILGGAAATVGATIGAICFFLIARSAFGEHLLRWAGPRAATLAVGFRADAFSYLLFLRLVAIFPFWLVNLVAAVCDVRLVPFAAATALGIVPATFAFAFVGAGLASAIAAQEAEYESCMAAGRAGCRLDFHLNVALTPELIAALALLGLLALVPVVVRRLRARLHVAQTLTR
jgi:uncharacterized membrane protein YdjX (TVP38/TMEM64 family)